MMEMPVSRRPRVRPANRYWCDTCKRWALWKAPSGGPEDWKVVGSGGVATCQFCRNRMWCTVTDPDNHRWPEEAWWCHCSEAEQTSGHREGCIDR